MSRVTLAVTICVGLALTTAPCYAELFSVEVPGLVGTYHGFDGISHETEFDFGQAFPEIDNAWLHIVGLSDIYPPGSSSALHCVGSLDGVAGPDLIVPESVEFDANVPLNPGSSVLDGTGTVRLVINVVECCDHMASVTGATLWFEVIPPPECGDGTIDPGEECDDGNTVSGDGCSSFCFIEPPPPEGVPTVSAWSLIVLTMLGLTAGTIMFARRRRTAAA